MLDRTRKEAAKRVETAVTRTASTAAQTVARKAPAGIGTAIAKTVAKATLVGAAGLAAYWITSKLRTLHYKSYADLRFDAATEYRRARAEAATKLGRPLNSAELASLAQWFKVKMAEINVAEQSGRSVSGLSNLVFGE